MQATEARGRVEILCPEGLHLRLAARFAQLASQFRAKVRVGCRDVAVDGKSILTLNGAGRHARTQLHLEAPPAPTRRRHLPR